VSVNLSLASLADTTLADQITLIVKSTGLSLHDMTLEVTETVAMTDVAPALENLTRLRMHGFGLSIDDYGTGFSSMQQLTRVPFTELKIDQSFIRGFAANSRLRPVVESSVEMARRLNIKSVAEGAETQEDWDALKAIGCDLVQGYFIGRPMDEDAFIKFFVEHDAGALSKRSKRQFA
jgi:EAL domain-containing protein (putative c-di-GMP-specific phosphodiesterase class I)